MVRLDVLLTSALIAGAGIFGPVAGLAQTDTELSTEEITDAFQKQKTRGLVIVPSGQQDAGTEAETANVEPAAAPAYTAVEQDSQVNIRISFDFDSASLREDQKPKLASLCEAMKSVDVSVFQIIGHTDSSGSAAYNERLSLLRAKEVKRYLVNDCGIAENRLNAIGMGESVPLEGTDPRSDVNRRVEFQALG